MENFLSRQLRNLPGGNLLFHRDKLADEAAALESRVALLEAQRDALAEAWFQSVVESLSYVNGDQWQPQMKAYIQSIIDNAKPKENK